MQLFTTEAFADWFGGLDDATAEDVATALDVVEQLGPAKAPPASREALLWYEHPSVARFSPAHRFAALPKSLSLAWDLEAWGGFRDYVKRVLAQLESPRFLARLARLGPCESASVLRIVRELQRMADPRFRWTLKFSGDPRGDAAAVQPETACDQIRRLYFSALEAAGFAVEDVPAHSLALRELARRVPSPAYRLLYGVHAEREVALFVLGEWLDRAFYGDSVRRAERSWKLFLDGELAAVEPAQALRQGAY